MSDVRTFRALVGQQVWDGAADQRLVCKQVQRVTGDVKSFLLEPVEPALFHHDPGQHLTIAVDIDGQEIRRCYTISSPPTRPHRVAITVKRVPGGLVSNWLHDHLVPGAVLRARGPFGEFSMIRHPAAKYLFLSAGSGVTPLMSMTRTIHDLAWPADVVFVHSARTPDDIIFRQELAFIEATAEQVRVSHVCEADGPTERWNGHRGRLNVELLRRIAPDFLDREVFTCGPTGYLSAVRTMLAAVGFPMDRHHQESFTGTAPAAETSSADGRFTVEFTRSGRTVECDTGTTVLDAAAFSGLTLPSSCGQGMCGTCRATLVKGSVEMRHNGGISPRDRAADKILLCCAKPMEDLVIDA
ncbi:hybrid-cluster NAD(P)-dependent oxidoreductase [Saccharopolyspora sp. K220]|uniref:hybrid-cluster NAD(P)-dependent oxidoreductase n=1 Tax=Saccharopolyspora soli TaxID=2926618 RepID=UPI001F5AF390|nr:hybrid-cluster NAD(P)-dependent oxidoreductase [Saccharopolyspora soli]MCI2422658.1 hybrid-cluster NAD(P)-dependent oxidoreductase [Saccharopolyspora soli]